MAGAELAISAEQVNHEAVVAVAGEVDLSTAPVLEERLSQFGDVAKLVVNLSGVTFLDLTGLRVLVGTANELADHGGFIRVVVSHPAVRKVFEISGLWCHLGVCSTLEQALSA